MPLMIPDDIEQFTTPGEEAFYRFLRTVAKPDDRFVVWYSPEISESEPDFILYNPDVGLIVFEVKDWVIDQIREVTPKKFVIVFGSKEVSCTNPHEQAKSYVFGILERIAKDGRLVTREAYAQGKPKIPISHGVVFANITSGEYRDRFANDGIIPLDKILFWDDLHPHSELYDPTGKAFQDMIRQRFEPRFPCHISSKELYHLRQLLYPTIRISPVERSTTDEQLHHEENVRLLDHHQEIIARKFDGGHRIISGPSGSGKTLVLVHQAVFLQKYNPQVKRILFVCFNVSLVNYLRRLLAANGASLGSEGVEVLQFYDLCARLTGEPVQHEHEDGLYYDMVVDDALTREVGEGGQYDAILVDEGQDFSDKMLQVVLKCLNRRTDFLTIVQDGGQDLYGKTRNWSDAGISARGRHRQLNIIYRNTKEIADFATAFRYGNSRPWPDGTQFALFPDPRISRGPVPTLQQDVSLASMIESVAEEIGRLAVAGTFPLSEMAVIYTRKHLPPDKTQSIPALLQAALDRRGVMHKWLSEDYRAKRQHDITANSVTISTIHSVKGLDFACVFLLGLDGLLPNERWQEEQINCLAYVGITRARYQLKIPYLHKTPLLSRLEQALSKG